MPLREIALLLLIPSICITALFRPKIGLYGYLWFAIVQPDVLAFCEAKYPFSLGLAVTTLIGSIRFMGRAPAVLRVPFVKWNLALQIPLALSIVFCEGPFLSMDRYLTFERTALIILLIPLLMESVDDIRHLMYTFGISGIMLGGRFGLYGLATGGALLDQPYGSLYDNNELALAVAMLTPLCWYAMVLTHRQWFKAMLLVAVLASGAAVIMTNSRGASLALATVLLCLLWRSHRRVLLIVAVAMALGPALYLVKDRYLDRMATIQNYQDESSAATRVQLWKLALDVWQEHPVLGVGFGNRQFAVMAAKELNRRRTIVAHNSYLQMAVDSGIFAFLIYTGLLFGAIVWLGRSARAVGPELAPIPIAFQTALLAFAVGSTFYSHQRYDLFYILLMSTAAWYQVSNTQLSIPADDSEQTEIDSGEPCSSRVQANF